MQLISDAVWSRFGGGDVMIIICAGYWFCAVLRDDVSGSRLCTRSSTDFIA